MSVPCRIEPLENRLLFAAAATSIFAAPARYTTGQSSRSVALGDFRHTGKLDMAVVNPPDSTVSILLNNGNGTYSVQPKIRIDHPVQVVAGDFNGDGNVDLIVLNTTVPAHATNLAGNRSSEDAITLYAGDGAGNFTKSSAFRVINGNHHLITADFNRDGRPDLAISTERGVGIILNTGGGTFAPEAPYTTSNSTASYITAGDFNGDGAPDLAVALGSFKSVRILTNNGAGAFTVNKAYRVPGNAVSIAAADFNGDGKLDLAVAGNGFRQGLRVLLGNGDGTFTLGPISASGAFLQSVVAGDFNGDGVADVAVVDFTSSVRVATGLNNGQFSNFAILPGGSEAFFVTAADLNGTGHLDLVLIRHDAVYVYLNQLG